MRMGREPWCPGGDSTGSCPGAAPRRAGAPRSGGSGEPTQVPWALAGRHGALCRVAASHVPTIWINSSQGGTHPDAPSSLTARDVLNTVCLRSSPMNPDSSRASPDGIRADNARRRPIVGAKSGQSHGWRGGRLRETATVACPPAQQRYRPTGRPRPGSARVVEPWHQTSRTGATGRRGRCHASNLGNLGTSCCTGLTADQSRCYTEFGLPARKTLFSEASWQLSALPVLT